MKKLATAIAAIALIGTPAFAADMAVKAPTPGPAAPPCLWCGFYIGGNAGVGWNHQDFTSSPQGTLVSDPFFGSLGWGESVSVSASHFIGGGQIGYNSQNGIWVVGAEFDFDAYGANSTNTNAFTPPGGTVISNSFSTKTPWVSTLRLRFGTTAWNPNLLLYATAGWALVRQEMTGLITAAGPTETFPFSVSSTSGGWVVGGGAEWAIDQHWSIKGEYLHIGGLNGPSQTIGATTFSAGGEPSDQMRLASDLRGIDIARGGVNYRF